MVKGRRLQPASRERKLPPVLPIVVHVGKQPWPWSMRLAELLADDAKAFLPFALGQKALRMSEAEEARGLVLWRRHGRRR